MDPALDEVWRSRARSLLTREPHGAHLPDEAWVALAEGRAVPGTASGALEHLARCAECRDILRAVHLLQTGHQALDGPARTSATSRWSWAAAVAALLIAGTGVWLVTPRLSTIEGQVAVARDADTRPLAPPASTPPAAPAPPTWLRVTPPTIAIYSPGVLTMRGGEEGDFADAFAEAMAPWQAGQYREAARRLDALTASHPRVAEGHYYKGVALLLDGASTEAVAPLERAVALAPATLTADASWYLGVALHQSGRPAQAVRAFDVACRAGRPLACEAAADPAHEDASRP